MSSSTLASVWQDIGQWLDQHAAKISAALQVGASEKQLNAAEDELGIQLPQPLRELYALHNGQDPEVIANLVYGLSFYPLESVIQRQKEFAGIDGSKLKYHDAKSGAEFDLDLDQLLAFGDDSDGCFLCYDLSPWGENKRIVFLDTEHAKVVQCNSSLDQLFSAFAADLQQGCYKLLPEALEDGEQWLDPAKEIDLVNWFSSSRWGKLR